MPAPVSKVAMPKAANYILCTTSRSGSTLLCSMLRAMGVAGVPDSWIHRPSTAAWAEGLGLAKASPDEKPDQHMRQILQATLKAGRGKTGVFGLRLMRKSHAFLIQQLQGVFGHDISEPDLFNAAFDTPRYIHLVRRDSLAQAISMVRALQSGLWHVAPDGTEVERLAPHMSPHYDRTQISTVLADLTHQKAAWETWFQVHKIAPHLITYEDLSDDPQQVLAGVLAFLGAERHKATGVQGSVAKISNPDTQDWAARYLSGN